MITIDTLHKANFDPYLNETFTVHSEVVGSQEVVLVELTEKNQPGLECFSLIFKGPQAPLMRQMTYTITHHQMGELQLFMVPVQYGKQDGIYYQSVFNRLLEK